MVIDTSAAVAILTNVPDEARYREAIKATFDLRMSALNVFECRVVLGVKGGDALAMAFDLLLAEAGVEIRPFDADQARLAYEAYRRHGRGSGHGAGLNLGDCAAYALARSLDAPLLYKGGDFAKTDVAAAV
ncbi:MAG: type II toxin-antitoxin system VapC family toxin [Kiloniellaceae bacterium]